MANLEHNFVDLAVVEAYNTVSLYVVECPAWKATVGGIVEFEADTRMSLGRIISKITVAKDCEEWNFINKLDGINPCFGLWEPVSA